MADGHRFKRTVLPRGAGLVRYEISDELEALDTPATQETASSDGDY